jgi:hypothetical protein
MSAQIPERHGGRKLSTLDWCVPPNYSSDTAIIRSIMTSDRVQRRIDGLLDQAEEAVDARDWNAANEIALSVLAVDPENGDALAFQAMAAPHVGGGVTDSSVIGPPLPAGEGRGEGERTPANPAHSKASGHDAPQKPTSFANGRYDIREFLGEGGKKRVYFAHGALLDREVEFALIKAEGFDETSRTRVTREAQAMWIRLTIMAAAAAFPAFQGLSDADRSALIPQVTADATDAVREYVRGDNVVFTMTPHYATGVA